MFNWNESLSFLPNAWRQTRGEGVSIAVLDSGIDLLHPDLAHLDRPGRKFDVTRPGFKIDHSGDDDVGDAQPLGRFHGTQVTSVIGADSHDGLCGIAPAADIYHIKVTDHDSESFAQYFFRGMEVALALDCDIISISYFPTLTEPLATALVDKLFKRVSDKKILVTSTVNNSRRLERFNNLEFPSDRPEVIVAGLLRRGMLSTADDVGLLSPKIDILLPETAGTYCLSSQEDPSRQHSRLSSSHATAMLAGVLALYLSFKRQQSPAFHRTSRAEALAGLRQFTLPLSEMMEPLPDELIFFQREFLTL